MRILFLVLLLSSFNLHAQDRETKNHFNYLDIFQLNYASDPQISPDGEHVVYRRMRLDIMKDRSVGNLWLINSDGTAHQKLTSSEAAEFSPRWSPSGDRIAFVSSTDEGSEVHMYWVNSGKVARISQLPNGPGNLIWSPDGKQLAFTMKVDQDPPVIAKMPRKPEGAKWAAKARITDRLDHEADGRGYIDPGFTHIFIMPALGGSYRQVTSGNFNHGGPLSFSPDGPSIFFSANRNEDWEYDFRNSEVYSVAVNSGTITALTDRKGPDAAPMVSPDGKLIAYLGYEDKVQTYQLRKLHLMNIDGSDKRTVDYNLDRSIESFTWKSDSKGFYFSYSDRGNTKIAGMDLNGKIEVLGHNVGGTTLGRPYSSGSFSASKKGRLAYTLSTPMHPADLAIIDGGKTTKITGLNDAFLAHIKLGHVEEVNYKSTVDGRNIQGWLVYPPDYDASKKYPFIVENHGGPIANYGDRFSIEMQLMAAKGYVVFYPNPRGSTSYGEEFGNLLYNNYPGDDYQDVMDGVDYCIDKGVAHEDQLFVAGGSAGGIMTAWIIGKNNRFEAAMVGKPVVNWISKTLVADNYYGYANYRYPGQPWENFEGYWKFSPLSLVGNVETPAMVMVGMEDLRTPPSEAKQYYHALKLRKIETVLVEIPEASHGIASRPSNLIKKVSHTIAWFEKYR